MADRSPSDFVRRDGYGGKMAVTLDRELDTSVPELPSADKVKKATAKPLFTSDTLPVPNESKIACLAYTAVANNERKEPPPTP